MIGIYKYQNLINNQVYIGQSVDIEHRIYTHKSSAYNKNVHEYNSSLSQAIRKFGLENFSFEILKEISEEEYNNNKNILNILEIEYVKKYNSYKNGYNDTPGGNTFPNIKISRTGEKNGRAKLTEQQVIFIRNLWFIPIPYREALKKCKNFIPSEKCFQKVWRWETWKNVKKELITKELLDWHKTNSKILSYENVHNSILKLDDFEKIKLDKDKYKGPTDYYKNNEWIQNKMSLSGFRKIWNKYILSY